MIQQFKLPKDFEVYLDILNQVFEVEKKLGKIEEVNSISRNLNRIKELFENDILKEIGFFMENPFGEAYDETRIELDANIAGEGNDNLKIIEVIKPVIRLRQSGFNHLVQKGIVIVKSENHKINE